MTKSQPLTEAPSKGEVTASSSKSAAPNWNDPLVPAGDAPPLPRWPLVASTLAWVAWLIFLLVMMTLRIRS